MVKILAVPALLVSSASAVRHVTLGTEKIESMPVHTYKKDCWKRRPVSSALLQNPGAGIDEFTPFETVEKDGFMMVDCVKDYMFTHGDKFGDNRHEYAVGQVSNVSIVHYADHVPKEDRQEMSQKACFEFCRTIPEMSFFGITNGRECYCTPYFEQMAGDSSDCDAVCEGETSTMCGGKSKSSVFSMHMCANTQAGLTTAMGKAGEMAATLETSAAEAKTLADAMQAAGDAGQKTFGKDGNPGASDLMQSAKESAGKLLHASEAAGAAGTALKDGETAGAAITDFTKPSEVTKAENLMDSMEENVAKGEEADEELEHMVDHAKPKDDANNSAIQYYNVMYFVDKEFKDVPTTCTGKAVAEPMVGASTDQCAAHCDAQGVGVCKGYNFFPGQGGGESLCFLLADFKTATYYTGCGKAPSFLQMQAASEVQCVAKLSEYEGTTLKPDGSGKCKQCLKEATKADRCFE